MILVWLLLRLGVLPRGYLIMRDDLLVMLSFLHVFSQQLKTSKTLTAAHALENVFRLLISSSNPNILSSDELPWNRKLLLEDVPCWRWLW